MKDKESEKMFLENEILLSKYFPWSIKKMLYNLRPLLLHRKYYVLCPYYYEGDIQIGVTGTCLQGELPINAIHRELGEEIGLVPKSIDSFTSKSTIERKTVSGIRTVSSYSLDIGNTRPVLPHRNNEDIVKGREDNINAKVACIVYGSESQVKNFLGRDLYFYKSDDGIAGVVALKFERIGYEDGEVYYKPERKKKQFIYKAVPTKNLMEMIANAQEKAESKTNLNKLEKPVKDIMEMISDAQQKTKTVLEEVVSHTSPDKEKFGFKSPHLFSFSFS